MRASCKKRTAVAGKRVQFSLFRKESYRGIWINGRVPEPHLQTERKANHAVTNDKKFGVQNNA